MNEDLARSLELDRWVVERCSSRSVSWAHGTAFFHDGFPNRFDQNFLRTERSLDGVSVAALAAEADRVLADFRHRKITIDNEVEGARLAFGFGELGWNGDHNSVMALHREPDRPGDVDRVEEVPFDVIRAFSIEVGRRDPRGNMAEPGVAEMLADSRRVLADEAGARFFVATAPDRETVASGCELYVHDDLAQVESVDTLEEFRGSGPREGVHLAHDLRGARAGRPAHLHLGRRERLAAEALRTHRLRCGRTYVGLHPMAAGDLGLTDGAANAQSVKNMYAPIAADYEEIWAPHLLGFARRLLDRLPLADADQVLDLGCGVGKLLPEISGRAPGAFVVGSDLVHAMVTRADRQFGGVAMDAMRLGFADDVFDAVVSSFALFHIPDPPAALAGVRRAMRPGGAIAIAVWGTGERFPAMTAWDEESDRIGVPPDPAASGPGDGREQVDSPDKLRGVLEQAGFRDASAERDEWILRWDLDGFLDWRRRMGTSRRRLAQLEPAKREEMVLQLANYVARLGSDALVHRDEVVLAFATA